MPLSSALSQRLFSGLFLGSGALFCLWAGPPWSTGLVLFLFVGLLVEWIWLCLASSPRGFSQNHRKILCHLFIFLGGLIYLWGAFLFCWDLVRPSPIFLDVEENFLLFIYLLVLVWATDISAYFVGKRVGGPRLASKISPQKTWSGFCGGLMGGGVAGTLAFPHLLSATFSSILAICFWTVCLVLIAQGGDLLESAVKRYFGVKDSSTLIPGHGGLWDRLDSFLAVTFFLFCLGCLVTFILYGTYPTLFPFFCTAKN